MSSKKFVYLKIISIVVMFVSIFITQQSTVHADIFNVISGSFANGSGQPVTNAYLCFSGANNHSANATTDNNGQYTVNVVPDTYGVNLCNGYSGFGLQSTNLTLSTPSYTIDATNSNATQDLQFDIISLNVVAKDAHGNPITNALTFLSSNQQGGTSLLTGRSDIIYSAQTNSGVYRTNTNGVSTISVLNGVGYNVCAQDPISHITSCESATPTNNNTTVTITLPSYNKISGNFTDGSGQPVANAYLCFNGANNHSANATTDADGNYSTYVAPDIYGIDLCNGYSGFGLQNTTLLASGSHSVDATISNVTQNLAFDIINLNIAAIDTSGNPVANALEWVSGDQSGATTLLDGRPDIAYTGQTNGPVYQADASGVSVTRVLRGMGYNVCAQDTINHLTVCSTARPTANNSTITITLPAHYTISGTFTDGSGYPVANADLCLNGLNNHSANATTDNNGNYTTSVTPDTYSINLCNGFNGFGLQSTNLTANPPSYIVDATNGNATQNLALKLVTLNTRFIDQNGVPIPNAYVYESSTGGLTSLIDGRPDITYAGQTNGPSVLSDSNGQNTFTVISGISYNVCALDPTSNISHCISYTATSPGPNNVIISEAPEKPNAPTGLSAPTPTNQAPVLTWNAVNGVNHYDVYRDGSKINSTLSSVYTDSTVNQGSHIYYILAINGSGAGTASDPSNTVTVVYDTTLPAISYSLSVQPNSGGWNNKDVTVTFSCSDTLAGIASCSSPITVSADGKNQLVSGSAVDKAGNIKNVTAVINIDKTAPIITATVSTPPNSRGWNNTSLTVSFNCNDALSGLASCPSPVNITTEGVNQRITGTATDNAGNTSTTTAIVSLDKTKPTIVATASPSPNANGWNNANVTVSFTCSDSLSGIYSCPSPVIVSGEGINQSVTGTAQDNAGNTNSVTISGINIDKTMPTISNLKMSNTLIIIGSIETLSATVSDRLSGVVGGEFYIDSDPGNGSGHAMTYANGRISTTANITGLGIGVLSQHKLYMRSLDNAGNWSTPAFVSFIYTGF